MAITPLKITAVLVRPSPRAIFIQSAKLSPTVVQRILMIQNHMVISGTLLSICFVERRGEYPCEEFIVLMHHSVATRTYVNL